MSLIRQFTVVQVLFFSKSERQFYLLLIDFVKGKEMVIGKYCLLEVHDNSHQHTGQYHCALLQQ